MALSEEFEKSGNSLFRKRSFIPLALFAGAALVIFFYKDEFFSFHNKWWNLACFCISMFGLIIRALTIGFTPKNTSGRNTKEGQVAETLNEKGIYSVVRHPLYLGNFFMWLGAILYVGIDWYVILCLAFFWIYYERIMFAEEQFIRMKFGDRFTAWAAKTPAFIPDLRKWEKAGVSFSLKNVLKREYSGFFGAIVSFVFINFIKNYFYEDRLFVDRKWIIAGIAGAVIFISLRTIKKYTKWLHVEGR
jgi:protein-S-isoprenylcysteine O-methyltransferase Ste14